MRQVRKYFAVYMEYIRTCFAEAASFRVNFVLVALMDLLFYATTMASIDFIFNHVDSIGPWGRIEFMLFISYMLTLDHLHMTLISESFWEFSFKVRQGTFDFILVRPIGSIFEVFFRHIRPATIPNFAIIWSVLIYYGLENSLTLGAWIFLPVLMIMSLALLVSLEIILSISTFWTIESFGINFLRMQMQQLSRWPDFVYQYFARKVFTIAFPLLLIGSAPVRFLLNPWEQWPLLVYFAMAIVGSALLVRWFWKLGLRSYESASS